MFRVLFLSPADLGVSRAGSDVQETSNRNPLLSVFIISLKTDSLYFLTGVFRRLQYPTA
jgi:hypothetical protein